MSERKLEFGIVGLGRIGGGLAAQALDKGLRVVGYTLEGAPPELVGAGLVELRSLAEFTKELRHPRVVFLYVPAGRAVDEILNHLGSVLEAGDVIVDGGNSYWGDSVRRARRLAQEHGVELVDCGTSGGVTGAREGACFMAGGTQVALAHVEPILRLLAVQGGYVHAGPSGAGHFTKLVHNGIEFGMLQAIGEGVELLCRFHEELPIADILRCWRHGSVIRSWLVELMEQGYREHGNLASVSPHVEDTGEVNWLLADALRMEVATPVINSAVLELFTSRDTRRNAARAVAVMRRGFGGHPLGPDSRIAEGRVRSRAGDVYRPELEDPPKRKA